MKDGGYIKFFRWLFGLGLSLSECVVLAYIIDNCAMNGGTCSRSLQQMADDMSAPAITIRRIVERLEKVGFIEVERGKWRGTPSVITIKKGCQIDTLLSNGKGVKMIPFEERKGIKTIQKGCQIDTLSEEKEKRSKKEKEYNKTNKTRVRDNRTREDAEAIIRDYERRRLDPNGTEWTPTAEEQARYEEARQVIRELDRAALVAEFKEVMAKYPDFAGWHQQPTVEQYAVLVERYGRADVAEALAYSANRLDLKRQYANPLAYVEMNIKNRRNRK